MTLLHYSHVVVDVDHELTDDVDQLSVVDDVDHELMDVVVVVDQSTAQVSCLHVL